MKTKTIALVPGDGSAPEMMKVACEIVIEAAKKDHMEIGFENTPMGWCAYKEFGDTLPEMSFRRAVEIGTIFFGGVGDPHFDSTIGKDEPSMKPEPHCLLPLREKMGLLLNFRPMIYYPELASLANVKPETIPDTGIQQIWIRFLLQDSYFGNKMFLHPENKLKVSAKNIGAKLKDNVTGFEEFVSDIAYYDKETVEKYFRAVFAFAKNAGLPVISIDKANVMARYDFWRRIATKIGREEFPEVPLTHQYVDSANALLFTPAKLHGVIACGNEHGDILSDGAASALGSMGMMCSSAVNPDTGEAMFESGAGTAPTLAGKDIANPVGRILTGAMMLRHIGAPKGAKLIEWSVKKALEFGYRTADIVRKDSEFDQLVGTQEMGHEIKKFVSSNL